MPPRRDGHSCREAVLLQAAEGIIVIEHETNFHLSASEPEVNFAAMRKISVLLVLKAAETISILLP
jgi:hypothetical protein